MPHSYKGHGFSYDAKGYAEVSTDGACSRNGTADASAGIGVFFGDNHPLNVSQPASGRQTNSSAEIQAATAAAQQASKANVKNLKIYTDSDFLYKSATNYMHRWKENGWKTASGSNVVNRDDFEEMNAAMSQFDNVAWEHVRSHNGTYGNEMADKFARNGIRK